MYHEFYQLHTDPFRLSPDHKFCLRHTTFSKAKAYMQFAVEQAEGFVMITGRPGTGKTTLIEELLSSLGDQEFLCAQLVSAQLEAEDVLRMTAFNFGIPAHDKSKSQLLLEMQGFFADRIADDQRPLLVVDEAQGLSLQAMEELRLLTNMRIDGRPMLQIFLVGQEGLRDLVLDPSMEQLHQRMIAACHLEPLDFKQTATYVMHRLSVAGWNGNPQLRARVFPLLYRFSRGVPRRINLFMGRLLLHGWLEEKTELSEAEAQAVFEELRNEHLAPTQAEADIPIADLEAMDKEFQAADQILGAMLMEHEHKNPASQPQQRASGDAAGTDNNPMSADWEGGAVVNRSEPAAAPQEQQASGAPPSRKPAEIDTIPETGPRTSERPFEDEASGKKPRRGRIRRFFRWLSGRKS